MRFTLSLILFSTLTISCSVKNGEYKEYYNEEINNLYFEYSLTDQKLTDTLKVYSLDKQLLIIQTWDNGSIITRSMVDESGKFRELELYERIDTTDEGISITKYFYDINDPSYRFFHASEDLCTFFINHMIPSTNSIHKDSSSIIELYNLPREYFFIDCKNGELEILEDKFQVMPKGQSGDTVQILIFGEKAAKGSINLEIE